MSWLYYLLEANLYLILFFAFYYLVLRRETFYQYNRAYLLVTSALAFIIPFVQLGMLKPAPIVPSGQLRITQIYYDTVSVSSSVVTDTSWTKEDYYLAAYLLIACCLLINLGIKIYKLIRLSQLNSHKTTDKWKIIETEKNKGAFSFFSYLFVSPEMALSETVIAHELVHIRQKHSWDIIYFELIKVVSWFNPIVYLLQHSIKELHEFIADSEIAGDGNNINQYTDFLLGNAYGIPESQLTNNLFNKSLLKKRIMMLHQKRSGTSARLKYLLVLPLSAGLLCASTLAFAKNYGWIDIAPKHASSEKTLKPDVNSVNKVKRLKVTQGGISAITDKISVRESKNKIGFYTAVTLTAADEARLLKNFNIKVEIIEVDSPAKPEEMKFPIEVHQDKLDTKNSDGDIIPVLSKGATGVIIDPTTYSSKTLTDMSLRFRKSGYKMKFDDYKDDADKPMLKISLRKSDSKPNTGASATFRVDELKKNGYVIFVGADASKNLMYVRSHKFILLKHDTSTTIPPPPPPAEIITNSKNNGVVKTKTGKAHTILYVPSTEPQNRTTPLIIVNGVKYDLPKKLKPGQYLYTHATDSTIQYKPGNAFAIQKWGDEAKNGVLELFGKTSVEVIQGKKDTTNKLSKEITAQVNSTINKEVKKQIDKASDNAAQQGSDKLPPPTVASPGFNTLFNYLGRNIHYPASEYEQKIVGNVVVELTLNSEHKITGIKVVNDARPAFGNEVTRASKRFADTINRVAGTYVIGVQFSLINDAQSKTFLPKALYPDISDKPNFGGIVEIVGYPLKKE
jgi:BlaR1 peptidase M56